MTLRYRTVFISDTHLGSRAAQAAILSRFLKNVRCDKLYLVGDIVDVWRMSQKWYWPGEHNNVIRRILNHTKHGTEVVFIPGNHDEGARQFVGMNFGGVEVKPYDSHEAADGRKRYLTHGDQFDLVVRHHRFLSMLGGKAYEMLVMLNRPYNAVRRRLGMPRHSMSKAIKLSVKRACTFIGDFEVALEREAQQRGLDGVVCGHIHKPEVREAEQPGDIAYYNCGDWIEDCTAIVEEMDGTIRLIYAEEELEAILETPAAKPAVDQEGEEMMPLEELISVARIFGDTAEGSTPAVRTALQNAAASR
ncbi:MAG: UDP-2,3-diacylglucosamine diphosphatase [Planctomycetota bacterium]